MKRNMTSGVTYVETTEGKVNGPVAVNFWRGLIGCGRASDHCSTITECVVRLGCCGNVLETRVA